MAVKELFVPGLDLNIRIFGLACHVWACERGVVVIVVTKPNQWRSTCVCFRFGLEHTEQKSNPNYSFWEIRRSGFGSRILMMIVGESGIRSIPVPHSILYSFSKTEVKEDRPCRGKTERNRWKQLYFLHEK
jgi:hypothetical protein